MKEKEQHVPELLPGQEVRLWQKEEIGKSERDEAVKQVVNDCIQNGILADFFKKISQVLAMSVFEYDKEEKERKLRKAEYEDGIKEGKR